MAQLKNWRSIEGVSTLEEIEAEHVVAEPTVHMLKATHPPTWKIIIEHLSPILHVLNELLQQIASGGVVDMMLQTQRSACGRIPIRPIRIDRMATVAVDQALQEKLSRQDVTRPRNLEAQKEPPIRLEGQPQPSLLAPDPDPSLIDEETSNTPDSEEAAEPLNPTPDRDVAPRTQILQTRGDGAETQTLKIHIHSVEHHNARSPLTFN